MTQQRNFIRVYVWELPVRLTHWINAACIVVLGVSGYLIAHPPAYMTATEASFGYWFGIVRFTHFVAAYVFVIALLARVYWAFAGNKFAHWRSFMILAPGKLKELIRVAKIEIFQVSDEHIEPLGHNAVSSLTYGVLFLLALFQIISGFGMYAGMSHAWPARSFSWVMPLFGSEQTLRSFHYAANWLFILFTIVHVYMVFYTDYVDGHGGLSGIISGWKFMDKRPAPPPTTVAPVQPAPPVQ